MRIFSKLLVTNIIFIFLMTYNAYPQQVIKASSWEHSKQEFLEEIGGKWHFTLDEAKKIGKKIGIIWKSATFDVDQFRVGLEVELEHGLVDPNTNVTNDDPFLTGKIALAHLNEISDYYFRLLRMEEEAEK